MAIHEVNGKFVALSRGVWIPGVFEDKRTARFAFRLPDEVLTQLQQEANVRAGGRNGVLTWGDLAGASEQARLKPPNARVTGPQQAAQE